MSQTTLVRDFQCVTGWRVPAVPWVGVRLGHLLDLAGPTPGADAVRLASFDDVYTESLTLEQARRPDVLVALQMLGTPVTHDPRPRPWRPTTWPCSPPSPPATPRP
jgi:DMSO/TMAO reductase YedYZ molybdopterin-dependent catalytic subunit